LRLIDRDYVDYTNLQRQWLYDEADARDESPKAIAAARRLHDLNHSTQIEPLVTDLTPSNAEELIEGCDLILDGTDNFETRYLINDACVKLRLPLAYGRVIGAYGLTLTIRPGHSACLRCAFPEISAPGTAQTCETAGVLAFNDAFTFMFAASVTGFVIALVIPAGERLRLAALAAEQPVPPRWPPAERAHQVAGIVGRGKPAACGDPSTRSPGLWAGGLPGPNSPQTPSTSWPCAS